MRERCNESERPKAPRRLSVTKNLARAQPAHDLSSSRERSGRRAGAECSRRGNQGAERRSRREKRTRGPPVSRPAACGGRDPGERSRGRARCFARGGEERGSRAVSVLQRPRCRVSVTESPERRPRSEPLEEFRPRPASGRCGVSPLEWGSGRPATEARGKAFPLNDAATSEAERRRAI